MNFRQEIEAISGVQLNIQVNLKKYTTYKLEVIGDIAICKSLDALKCLIQVLVKNHYTYNVVGWGANQVLANTDNVLFIKLDFPLPQQELSQVREKYYLPASTPLNVLTSHAQKFGLTEWEVFTGIPASLGGAIYMNAGTGLGEICQIVESVEILGANGKVRVVAGEQLKFSYRKNHFVNEGDIIIAATLLNKGIDSQVPDKIKQYLNFRKETQPINTHNCGCVFKNHSPIQRAGHHIDLIGLKGLTLGGLKISLKHANFIENMGDGSSAQFCNLVEIILDELEYSTGIKFELEAKVY